MNNKGFTLVELLVTLALIAIMATLIVVNTTGLSAGSEDTEEIRFERDVRNAGCYYVDSLNMLSIREQCFDNTMNCQISLGSLIEKGWLDQDMVDPKTSKKISEESNDIYVDIKWNNDLQQPSFRTKDCKFVRGEVSQDITNFEKYVTKLVVNPNGGAITLNGQTYTSKKTISQFYNTFINYGIGTKPGYTFKYWSKSGDCGTLSNMNGEGKYTFPQSIGKTCTLTANWEKTCSININQEFDFPYTGSVQEFNVPCDGNYKFEVWGAQGGGPSGGYGGYSVGSARYTANTPLYVYVGGQGSLTTDFGGAGYNGGGIGYAAYGGGGMTHISDVNTDNLKGSAYSEIVTNTTYPATTTNKTVTYQGKTAGSSWSATNNKNWTIIEQYTASATSSVTFISTSDNACPSCPYDPVCRITINGNIAVQDDDGGRTGSSTGSYNFRCVTTVNKGDKVTYEVSSFRDSGGTVPTTISLPARVDQSTVIRYSESGSFSPSSVVILAGGGGGATSSTNAAGGSGGGIQSGQTKVQSSNSLSYSASQSSGYKQGLGSPASVLTSSAGAGGGWYGGKVSNNTNGGAGGGSGYIGNSLLTDRHMTCYNCPTSTSDTTYTRTTTNVSSTAKPDYVKQGNGYARITYLGE